MKETYHIEIAEAGNSRKDEVPVTEYDFTTDNVYKSVAEIIGGYNAKNTKKGYYFRVTDTCGRQENFWVVKEGYTRYCTYKGGFPKDAFTDAGPRYLTCIDEETNEYKYYTLIPDEAEGVTRADYGRIGCRKGTFNYGDGNYSKDGTYTYPLAMFWVKYYEKLGKGYVDRTGLRNFAKTEVKKSGNTAAYRKISDENVRRIIENLIRNQRNYISSNYNLSIPFSKEAVTGAKKLLAEMYREKLNPEKFTSLYTELAVTLPRRIENVKEYIHRVNFTDTESENSVDRVLAEEQMLLDNFTDFTGHKESKEKKKSCTVLTENKIKARTGSYADKFRVLLKAGKDFYKISEVLTLENETTKTAYRECVKEMQIEKRGCHLLWHGSRTENWWSIIKNGLSLNPDAVITGKMFGNGLYFAPLAGKSMNYTDYRGSYWAGGKSEKGYLALYEVAMGKPYEACHSGNYTMNDIKSHGCMSLWAYPKKTGLLHEECVIYDSRQCNIKYLVEIDAEREMPLFQAKTLLSLRMERPVYDRAARVFTARVKDLGACVNSKLGTDVTKDAEIRYSVNGNSFDVFPADVKKYLKEGDIALLEDIFRSKIAEREADFEKRIKLLAV